MSSLPADPRRHARRCGKPRPFRSLRSAAIRLALDLSPASPSPAAMSPGSVCKPRKWPGNGCSCSNSWFRASLKLQCFGIRMIRPCTYPSSKRRLPPQHWRSACKFWKRATPTPSTAHCWLHRTRARKRSSSCRLRFFPDAPSRSPVSRYMPTLDFSKEAVKVGILISYGADFLATIRRQAYFVDRTLKGAKPADLPVEEPAKFELAINLKTANALGLTVPDKLLATVDEAIE